ncbi:Uncharacterised protein [uncultured archaeon]|nr:Uncharacterised protein [uncultured archaeon]
MALLEEVASPFMRLGYGVIDAVPGVIAAILILIVGYIVAWIASRIVGGILDKVRFDRWVLHKTNFTSVVGEFRLSHFLEVITKWYVFILFLPAAANVINLGAVQNFLLDVAMWIPQVILAVVIGLLGLMAADYVGARIVETRAKGAHVASLVARGSIWVFTAIIVLDQIGVKIDFATNSLLIILAGIMFGLALTFGIGFGFALKDDAKKILSDFKRKL